MLALDYVPIGRFGRVAAPELSKNLRKFKFGWVHLARQLGAKVHSCRAPYGMPWWQAARGVKAMFAVVYYWVW